MHDWAFHGCLFFINCLESLLSHVMFIISEICNLYELKFLTWATKYKESQAVVSGQDSEFKQPLSTEVNLNGNHPILFAGYCMSSSCCNSSQFIPEQPHVVGCFTYHFKNQADCFIFSLSTMHKTRGWFILKPLKFQILSKKHLAVDDSAIE